MPGLDDSLAAAVRARLDAVDWDVVIPNLTFHALRRLGGRSPERAKDIAQEAIARAYNTKRMPWKAGTEPDVFMVLCGFVNGLVQNERRRKRTTQEVSVGDDIEDFGGGATPEQLLAHEEEWAAGFVELRSRVANDTEAIVVVDLFERRIVEAAEQATAANVLLPDIRKARRRVFRAMEAMEREREEHGEPAAATGTGRRPSRQEMN